jgi:hypothetical protein
MAEIVIERGKYRGEKILMDDSDYGLVNQYYWYIFQSHGCKYAQAKIKGSTVYMHRLIMNPPEDMVVDHINFNGLDNRRKNLRIVTLKENSRTNSKREKLKSHLHGVYPDLLPGRQGYYSKIGFQGKRIYIGHFTTQEEAARSYDRKALELFGDEAILNYP